MQVKEIVSLLQAEPLLVCNDSLMDYEFDYAFATDLMSDALAMIQTSPEDTVLITGLCNSQVLRTAEMLDIELIIFVRGKMLGEEAMEIAREMGFNIYRTDYTMYTACGILYSLGLRGING